MITRAINVNPLPAAIAGAELVCVGLTTALTDASSGGTWSNSTPSVGTITGTGVVSGLTNGTDTVTYTLATGCRIQAVVTVNSVPTAISGTGSICVGATLTLTDSVSGGSWSSVSPAVATAGAGTGVVLGVSAGTATILYTSGGCGASVTVTVIAAPEAISGPHSVCAGGTVTETDAAPAGTWTSGAPSLASVSPTGVVTGISSGTVIISYTLSTGCSSIIPVVVNPLSAIAGTPEVCVGQTTALNDTTDGGTWSSSSAAIGTVNTAGIVWGISAGVTTITYLLPTGCYATQPVTVNPVPLPVTGATFEVCPGSTITLSDASPAGSWSSSLPSTASVTGTGSGTSTVTGDAAGIAVISYTYGTGCAATQPVTVNADPAAISGPDVVCIGGTIELTDTDPGGMWTSSSSAVAPVGSASGIVTGSALGTATITYQLPTGCTTTATVTVNPVPAPISGAGQVCVGATVTFTGGAPGGSWSSSASGTASVDAFGDVTGVTGGTATITYSIGSGCQSYKPVTVNPIPDGIGGSPAVCQGQTLMLTDMSPYGTWSSSDPATAAITSITGVVTGIATGSVTITYALTATSCYVTYTEIVNPSPAPITGSLQVCVGYTTLLSDATGGGGWSSSNPAIATVAVGTVTGSGPGIATISYTGAFGCAATAEVTVSVPPDSISGSPTVCQGYPTTWTDGVPAGVWTSSDGTIASAGAATGIITGVSPGTATITYSVGAGCSVNKTITVNPTPVAIGGPVTVCATQTIRLTDATPGGTWSSAVAGVATVTPAGVVTGLTSGTTVISYTNGAGCAAMQDITVNPMPAAITGNASICLGGTSALSDLTGPGTWFSSNPAVATIGSLSGVVTGVSLGTSMIVYMLPAGCSQSLLVQVYPLPVVYNVSGGGNYCAGGSGEPIYLSGSAIGVNYLLYLGVTATGSFAGTGSPMDYGLQTEPGVYTVIATSTATGCSIDMAGSAAIDTIATVRPSLTLHATPGDTVCTGTPVTFSPAAVNGGTSPFYQWSVNGTAVATTNTYTYLPANGDVVMAQLTSNATCPRPASAYDSLTVKVDPYGRPSVSLTATPNDTVCQGTEVTVTPLPVYGGPSPLYSWVKDGVLSGTGGNYVFVPVNNDQVYAIMTSDYLCRLNNVDTSAVMVINTDTPLVPVVTITASPGTTIMQGQTLTLTATVVNGGASPTYQWIRNSIPITGATNATYSSDSFSLQMEDSVVCQVTGSLLCKATGYKWVYIQEAPAGVATVTGGGNISITPNPNKGDFTVKGTLGTPMDEEVGLEITDVLGQVVYKDKLPAKNGRLNSSIQLSRSLANGIYLLTLHTNESSIVFHMIIEQ